MSYEVVESVDVLEDKNLQQKLVWWSLGVCAVGLVVTVLWLVAGWPCGRWGAWPWWFLTSAAVSILALPVHELIHGAAFKLLGPKGLKLIFGYKDGMLYCGCPGVVLNRRRMIAVLLAPTVVLTLAFALLGWLLNAPLVEWVCVWVHLSGCVGDLLMVAVILQHPEAPLVRDTDTGIDLVREDR